MQISFVDMQMRPEGLMGLGSWGGRGGQRAEPREVPLPPGKSGFHSGGIAKNYSQNQNCHSQKWDWDEPFWGQTQQERLKTRKEKFPKAPLSCLGFPGIIPDPFSYFPSSLPAPALPNLSFSCHGLFENQIFLSPPFSHLLQPQGKIPFFSPLTFLPGGFFGN